jgi:hypothetical protein
MWLQQVLLVQSGQVVGYQPLAAVGGLLIAIWLGLVLFRQPLDAIPFRWRALRGQPA